MLRAELVKQGARPRTVVALGALVVLPVVAAVATAGDAGHRHGRETGLYGAATFSALNHAAASLQFVAPLLLVVVVGLLGAGAGAADAQWGTLRYLLVRPVPRTRLVAGKLLVLALLAAAATVTILVAGVLAGAAAFGWHGFHRLGGASLPAGTAILRLVVAAGYVTLCTLTVGALALAVGILSDNPTAALSAALAATVAGNLLSGITGLGTLARVLPMHYWDRWADWLAGARHGALAAGAAVQLAWVAAFAAVAAVAFARRDISS